LSALNCEAACGYKESSAKRPTACVQSCLSQKSEEEAALQQRFDAIAERQRQAWRWVEQMTGRDAASWQPR